MSIRRLGLWGGNGSGAESGERVSGWEQPVALRDVSRMMGKRAVGAWEGGVRGEKGWRDGGVGDEDVERVVLFVW